MRILNHTTVALAASILSFHFVHAQLILPLCVSECIEQSSDNSCSITDIKCICRESNGRFLPDLILCLHGACDPDLDISTFLTPLSLVCDILGTPLSPSALQSAENQASSLALQTVTVAQTASSASTATQNALSKTVYTGFIPVIIVGTNGVGSLYTSTTTEHGAISTIITTNSAESTATVISTYTQAGGDAASGYTVQTITTTNSAGSTYATMQNPSPPSSSSSSGSGGGNISSITATTGVGSQSATSSLITSKISTIPDAESTNSSPFGFQSMAGQGRVRVLLGMIMLLVVIGILL